MKKTLYITALALSILSCKKTKTEEPSAKNEGFVVVTKDQFQGSEMQMGQPSIQDFDVVVKASGKIDVPPQNKAIITPYLGGYVKATHLLIGDKVVKGQALLTLENTEYVDLQKEYLDVAEQIDFLKSEFDRQKTLYNEQISSQKNYLKAQSDYRRSKGIYETLRKKLQMLNINPKSVEQGRLTSTVTLYAPISGSVSVMKANLGQFMSPSDIVMEIIDNQKLHVELAVFEKDILKIKPEQVINFRVPEASNENYQARVHLVGKSIESNDRTINVHCDLDEKVKQKLISGMFVEASIVVDDKKALAVPADALIKENNKYFVLLLDKKSNLDEYKFKKVAVSLGEKSEKYVEILPNDLINESSKILVKGVFDAAG